MCGPSQGNSIKPWSKIVAEQSRNEKGRNKREVSNEREGCTTDGAVSNKRQEGGTTEGAVLMKNETAESQE